MQKKDLIPTYENVCSTFCEDSIGRNEELMYFVNLLDSITGAYSIALDGRWGSGKTFFVKQAKMLMDTYNPFSQLCEWNVEDYREKIKPVWEKLTKRANKEIWEPKPQLCVYFDAWEFDSESDPISALLYQIAMVVTSEYNINGERNATEIIGNILDVISGRNVKELLQSLKTKRITDEVKSSFDVRNLIDQYFSLLLPEHGDRLIIFIDELDRCVPSYAVKLLERIKHYFSNEKITFVFSLNMEQMQHTVCQHYGKGFDSHKYIERFFDLTISMPKIKRQKFYNYLSYDVLHNPTFQIADAFAQQNHMEMREITRFYAALNMMTRVTVAPGGGSKSLWFCFHFLLPVAVGLQKCNITKYYQFINGEDSSPLIDLLSNENVLDYVYEFFAGAQETEAKQLVEKAYQAILVDAKYGKSNTIQGHHYNESAYNYLNRTMSLLCSTTCLE